MTKILVAGDTHAAPNAARLLTMLAEHHEVQEIWQCGDLGWWPRQEYGKKFIKTLRDLPVPLYFADGNHEDHDCLTHDAPSEYEVAPNVVYVPRGVVRTVHGRRVMFFGGARSVDRTYRTPGVSWFAEELPTHEQHERARSQPADIVVAHDSPLWVDYGYPPHHQTQWPNTDLEIGDNFRHQLSILAAEVQPKLWFNGHHHKLVRTGDGTTAVWSLGESTQEPSQWCVILDLDTLEVTRC